MTALVSNTIVAGIGIAVFTLVRRHFPLIYEPRSVSISRAKREQPLSSHILGWPTSVFNADLDKIKDINGLDCYFFVRFLRMMARIMLPTWLLSWAVLLPLTYADEGSFRRPGRPEFPRVSGLDKFMIGSITPNNQGRYVGHLSLTWIFTIWIWFNIKSEMSHYVDVRQEYLVSPAHSSTDQACSVLVTGIPPKYLSELSLTRLFGHLPGGVRQVWINRDLKEMPKLYERRLKVCNVLESAGTSLLSIALKRNKEEQKRAAKAGSKEKTSAGDPEAQSRGLLELVPRQNWPSHRLPLFSWLPFSIPFVGTKVDTIKWACEQVHELTMQLEKRREILASDIFQTSAAEAETTIRTRHIPIGRLSIALPSIPEWIPFLRTVPVVDFSHQTYPPANAAFILFNKQIAAHIAAQTLTHKRPYRMSASQKHIEVAPEDVIWENLTMNNYDRRVRFVLSWAATIGLTILCSYPVLLAVALSSPVFVCTGDAVCGWLDQASYNSPVIREIQGFLPNVLVAILVILGSIILRILARWEGIPQKTGVELSLMNRFFLFQIIITLLVIITSSGGLDYLNTFKALGGQSMLPGDLAMSSTFFLTHVLLQGLSGTGKAFLQARPLVMHYFKKTFLASTPRSVCKIKYLPRTSEWGTLFPTTTQLAVITFGFSIICPIINGLAFAAFSLFYFLYKYLFTWVNDQPPSSDTGGLFFPKAMNHVFVGLYIQQVCLCALFFFVRDEMNSHGAIPEGALMIVLIVFTAFVHDIIHNSYGPLVKVLPLTLADSSFSRVEPEVPTADFRGADVSAPDSHQPVCEVEPLLRDGVNHSPLRRVTTNPPGSSPSLLAKLVYGEGTADFRHPVAAEKQRVIWLPEDPLGLVKEIARELDSRDILHSTEGAKMDSKGYVDVVPEDTQDAPTEGRPSPLTGEDDSIW